MDRNLGREGGTDSNFFMAAMVASQPADAMPGGGGSVGASILVSSGGVTMSRSAGPDGVLMTFNDMCCDGGGAGDFGVTATTAGGNARDDNRCGMAAGGCPC